jgi:glutamate/tyrosine decarboxylase-like PLP-dependent enzyme
MAFDHASLPLLAEALASLELGFAHLPESAPEVDNAAVRAVLLSAAERMRDNYPYQHPLYVGQMLKPPHAVARLAYALSMWVNPNNHALDGGRASSAMEREAVAHLAAMFGWEKHLGHLCGGGTIANFEALWVARELHPGQAIVASQQSHYTHARLSAVLGVPFFPIAVDGQGRMDVAALESELARGRVGTVVVTLGTTPAGAVDPLPDILALRRRHEFRVHVDAAYGGYFRLARNLRAETHAAFQSASGADSIAIDPHKHGLQPYGCGCVLFADPAVGRFYRHDSPYTYFSSPELHLGEISLECSRPGAAAVALWATQQLLPLVAGGAFAAGLEAGRDAALELHAAVAADARFVPLFRPELDIVVWAVRAPSAQESSARARAIFAAAARRDLHLALAGFPRAMVEGAGAVQTWDSETVVCLRSCVMKPEHRNWLPQIVSRLRLAANDVMTSPS